jgi:hypothetical protein
MIEGYCGLMYIDYLQLSDNCIDGEEMGMVGNIPDLSTITDPEYAVHVVTTVVQVSY